MENTTQELQSKNNDLVAKLTLLEKVINKPFSQAETQTDLTGESITNLHKSVAYYQQLSEQKAKTLDLTQQELQNSQSNSEELEKELASKEQVNQEQLRKINILFDENSQDYKTINFDGLYSLLQIIAEREK